MTNRRRGMLRRVAETVPSRALLALAVVAGASAWAPRAAGRDEKPLLLASGSSSDHTCAVTVAHDLYCWGSNSHGQLGDGTTQRRSVPVEVATLHGAAATVATGHEHTCAITTGGGIACWGRNANGQLGDGTFTQRLKPSGVQGLAAGAVAIGAGFAHTCAVLAGGSVRCWGNNYHGQIGNGALDTDRTTASDVPALASGVASITSGDWHNCVLMKSGGIKCWGENTHGQLGNGNYGTNAQPYPMPVVSLGGSAVAVSAGEVHTCAVLEGGGVRCWGRNGYGQLGNGSLEGLQAAPVSVMGLTDAAGVISSGSAHTCVLRTAGQASCWGRNQYGQLGDGSLQDRAAPGAVAGGRALSWLTDGSGHTCGTDGGGQALCWGRNDAGQLGRGTTDSPQLSAAIVEELGAAVVGGVAELSALSDAGGESRGAPLPLATVATIAALTCASLFAFVRRAR